MIHYAVSDSTGKVRFVLAMPLHGATEEELTASVESEYAGYTVTVCGELFDADDSYYDAITGTLKPREVLEVFVSALTISANGVDETTISGVPAGWAFDLGNGVTGLTDGSDITFTAIEPGDYHLKFTKWPYQDVEVVIHATPAF